MAPPRPRQQAPARAASLSPTARRRLTRFKAFAVSHPLLQRADTTLMQAIREPAGFSHVLVYGPSGVGKSTMMRQIAQRLNPAERGATAAGTTVVPVLLLETRPPDAATFHRADYYRTALKTLGEPFFERRVLVDIDAEPTWEKKGRKTTRFQDSAELRHALEDALRRHGVRAVVLDEAQHLMHVGTGARLLDQFDWIKSMTNVTEVLHILLGTYDLLAFRNLSGQASRRSLDIHFARYQFQQEQDCRDFQGVLLALLQQVPLAVEVESLMQHWVYFYERSIGCVGILKDWLVRAVATALHEGSSSLSLARIQEHALSAVQCERLALEATEGEQVLTATDHSRVHLWSLLHMEPVPTPSAPPVLPPAPTRTPHRGAASARADGGAAATPEATGSPDGIAPAPARRSTRRSPARPLREPSHSMPTPLVSPTPRTRKKAVVPGSMGPEITGDQSTMDETQPPSVPAAAPKRSRRVGERKPVRDPVG
jgi:energy-coupling factor transporter ATP-binding protein EcfA2